MSKAKAENRALPKKFFTQATAVDGRILLDGKELKTQARKAMRITPPALAEAVAAEWNGLAEFIDPAKMPLTRLVNLTHDRAAIERDAYIENILGFAGTDLLCYRDPAIAERQAVLYDPVLAWAREAHAIHLEVTDAVLPIAQPEASIASLASLLATTSDAEITALAMMVPILGSAVLGVAVWQGQLTPETAISLARLDEDVQAERWGNDPETEASWAHKALDIQAATLFLTLCSGLS